MKYVAILLMLAGGYFIFSGGSSKEKKPKLVRTEKTAKTDTAEDYQDFVENEVSSKKKPKTNSTKPKTEEDDSADFAAIDNSAKLDEIKSEVKAPQDNSKTLDSIPDINQKENTINAAMVKVSELNSAYIKNVNANINGSALKLKQMSDNYIKQFVKELGKAYVVAEGHDKAALKYLKEFEVSWERNFSAYNVKMEKMDDLLSFDLKGDVNKVQSTNKYALTEMSKLIKGDTSYMNSAFYNFSAAMKKFKIENENIKTYFYSYGKSIKRLLKPRIELNNSGKVLIDKFYEFNSLVRQATQNNKLVITRQSQADHINNVVKEANAARADYKTKLAIYNSSN